MKKIYISESGPLVSEAIYGFWRWNNNKIYSTNKVDNTIKYNLYLGINTFDLSPEYGNGKAEEEFGKAISKNKINRDEIVISTKVGYVGSSKNCSYIDLSKSAINKSLQQSLKRLKTDYVDILLLEGYDPLINIEETASVITELKLKGKIKYVGVTNFSASQHKLIQSRLSFPVVTNHIELSLLNTTALDDGRIDFIKEQYSKPLAWAPLAGGNILNSNSIKATKLRKTIIPIAEKYNTNIESIAVAWLYKLGALPIIGSTDKQRIKNVSLAAKINLLNEEWHLIYKSTK